MTPRDPSRPAGDLSNPDVLAYPSSASRHPDDTDDTDDTDDRHNYTDSNHYDDLSDADPSDNADRPDPRQSATDPLAALILDARDQLARDLTHELRDAAPDLAAVVEAAHARDPRRLPRHVLDDALALAPVVSLRSEATQSPSPRAHAEFNALLADARGEIDDELAALRRAGWPPAPVPKDSPTRGPRHLLLWLAAAAAALLLALASPMLATRFEATHATATQAPWWQRPSGGDQDSIWREPPTQRRAHAPTHEPAPDPLEPALDPLEPAPDLLGPLAPDPVPHAEPLLLEAPTSKPIKPALPAREAFAARLRRLGGEAEQAWQSGDPAGAERRHREIIALAPGSRAADLSYGDLFTLARQRSGPDQETSLWREYLAAFPRGRYADDARAGLCRRADPDQRAPCWQRYLLDFPRGVHRAHATRAQDLEP